MPYSFVVILLLLSSTLLLPQTTGELTLPPEVEEDVPSPHAPEYLNALNIGTISNGTDVVHHGIVQFDFQKFVHSYTVSTDSVDFYLTGSYGYDSLTVDHALVSQQVPIPDPSHCTPHILGLSHGTHITPDEVVHMKIKFPCKDSTMVGLVNVTLMFDDLAPIFFYFTHLPRALPTMIDMGTDYPFSDVIYQGEPLPLWSPLTFPHEIEGFVRSLTVFAVTNDNSTVSLGGNITGTVSPPDSLYIVVSHNETFSSTQTPVTFEFYCREIATVDVVVSVPIEGYGPVRFGFKKDCKTPNLNINVGTQPHGNDVVSHGKVTLAWYPNIGSAFKPSDYPVLPFYIQIGGAKKAATIPITHMSITATDNYCHPYFLPLLTNATHISQTFSAYYNCSYHGFNKTDTKFLATMIFDGIPIPVQFEWMTYLENQPATIDIGLTPEDSDVAYNGVVTPLFQPSVSTYFIPGWRSRQTFSLRFTSEPVPEGRMNILFINYSALPPNNGRCTLELEGSIANGGIIRKGEATEITVVHDCHAPDSSSSISIDIGIESYLPVTFQYTKRSGGVRAGFCVGTQPGSCDVVSYGTTLPLWNKNVYGTGGHQIDGDVPTTSFWVSMAEERLSQFYQASVGSSIPSHVEEGMVSGNATYSKPLPLTIAYDCEKPYASNVTVVLIVEPFNPIFFSWVKHCGVPLSGLSVGISNGGDEVVTRGIVRPTWMPTSTNLPKVENNQLGTRFWVDCKPSHEVVTIIVGSLTVPSTSVDCYPYFVPDLTGDNATVISRPLDLYYNCSGEGEMKILTSMFLVGPYTPPKFAIRKLIGGPRRNIAVGTKPFEADVVNNGTTSLQWTSSAPTPTHVPEKQAQITFWFNSMSDASDPFGDIPIKAFVTEASPPSVYITSNSTSLVDGKITTSPTPVTFTFECIDTKQSNITISLKFDGFDPLFWVFVKDCPPRPKGVNVGTTPELHDVVYNGNTLPTWNRNWGQANATVYGSSFESIFYAELKADDPTAVIKVKEVQISTGSLRNCTATHSPLSSLTAKTQQLKIFYNCSVAGKTDFLLLLSLDEPYTDISWAWTKEVGGTRRGLNVGTTVGGDNIVKDGVTNPSWHTSPDPTPSSPDPDTLSSFALTTSTSSSPSPSVSALEWTTTLYFSMDPRAPIGSSLPHQKVTSISVAIPTSECQSVVTGTLLDGGVVTYNSTSYLTITYHCHNAGIFPFSVDVTLPPFDPLRIVWDKLSDGVPRGLSVTVLADGFKDYNVVSNGIVNEIWHNHSLDDGKNATTTTRYPTSSFNISMANNPKIQSFPFLTINSVSISATPTTCSVIQIGDSQNGGIIGTESSSYLSLEVSYEGNCSAIPVLMVEVTMTFNQYETISFFYQRLPAEDDGGPFPVFVILLIVVGVLLGVFLIFSALNYFVLSKMKKDADSSESSFDQSSLLDESFNIQDQDIDDTASEDTPFLRHMNPQ